MADEIPLAGGHMNAVVRVGDSVRRRQTPASATTQRLLAHVRARGVRWAPEPRGFDEHGREVLAFVEGEVPHSIPAWIWSNDVLDDVARALREWHDASASFERAGAVWNLPAREPDEVICHSDFAPYNCVFSAERFAGAIDFELCAPGPRLWDIAYTAYRFVPLMPPWDAEVPDGAQERSPFDRDVLASRLDRFLDAYSGADAALRYTRDSVIEAAISRLGAIAAWTTEHVARTGQRALEHHARMYRAHAAWLSSER